MSNFKCYEIHRANMPQYGCTEQCAECKIRQSEKEGNMITDWLEEYGNPEIEKQVEKEAEEKFLFDTAIEQRTIQGLKGTLDGFIAGAQWMRDEVRRDEQHKCELKCIDSFSRGYDSGYEEACKISYSEEEVKALIIRAVDEFSAFHSNTLKMKCAEEFFDKNKK